MIFTSPKTVPIPNKDLLSWIFDEQQYDADKPVSPTVFDASNILKLARTAKVRQCWITRSSLTLLNLRAQYHQGRPSQPFASWHVVCEPRV
jgi:hypothetical protein